MKMDMSELIKSANMYYLLYIKGNDFFDIPIVVIL